ncbi:multidrug efflux SMR transporter [Gordonia sp. HY285]|uniref:Multidrug efflux SMR transporter n=1 Tax=Gordonia liuliyuniae TaxID=2911517 RepID=A0ABS9IY46_9ACTN|nr:multidrug efflux SMR transporter [Gordonia liuliyuniae]MCF8590498.1 multidrug efflux SMR transporter [Gordonia liuliyuniae]MCF8611580.1 multidrug efflux SMR transporter [Gordonia liuliyuniae]
MNARLLLVAAIVAEVIGTLALRATIDHRAWIAVVIVGYVAAFTLLGLTLRSGMSISAAYGIWGASGVSLVALLGMIVFGETLSPSALVGIALIVVGVVLIETDPRRAEPGSVQDVNV